MCPKLSRRHATLAGLTVGSVSALASARSPELGRFAGSLCDVLNTPSQPVRPAWTFRSASPFCAPPSFAPSGQAYLASHEGYLHALTDRGAFRWSYTVKGGLTHRPATDSAGRVYASSSRGHLYAISERGNPHWLFTPPAKPRSPLCVSPKRQVHYTSERFLYAAAIGRGIQWRVKLPAPVVSGPACDPDGGIWLVTSDGKVFSFGKQYGRRSFKLPLSRSYQLCSVGPEGALVLAGDELLQLDRRCEVTGKRSGVESAALGDSPGAVVLVTRDQRQRRRVALMVGGELREVGDVPFAPTATPARKADTAFVPGPKGELLVASAQQRASCYIGSGPLMQPVFDPQGRLWVTSGDGVVATFTVGEPNRPTP